jgi:hypothetical protein
MIRASLAPVGKAAGSSPAAASPTGASPFGPSLSGLVASPTMVAVGESALSAFFSRSAGDITRGRRLRSVEKGGGWESEREAEWCTTARRSSSRTLRAIAKLRHRWQVELREAHV